MSAVQKIRSKYPMVALCGLCISLLLACGGGGSSVNSTEPKQNSGENTENKTPQKMFNGHFERLKYGLIHARSYHTATLLNGGDVLIVGGETTRDQKATTEAELYSSVDGQFKKISQQCITPRMHHTATLLQNGSVLIVGGGKTYTFDDMDGEKTAEIYDPMTQSFNQINMAHPRRFHTATLLKDGRVLITGGVEDNASKCAEIYDPKINKFNSVNTPMTTGRHRHSATLLQDGKVLIAGGIDEMGNQLVSMELFDPQQSTFTKLDTLMQNVKQTHSTVRAIALNTPLYKD